MNKIKDFLVDLMYTIFINPIHNIKYQTKWFIQRRIRTFDDREIWNMDISFYSWLLPRLKRFSKKTICYPEHYKAMSSWQKDLVNRVCQLESIIKYYNEEYEFPNPERYLTEKEIKEYKKTLDDGQIKAIAYNKCIKNFNRWFYNSVNELWY